MTLGKRWGVRGMLRGGVDRTDIFYLHVKCRRVQHFKCNHVMRWMGAKYACFCCVYVDVIKK